MNPTFSTWTVGVMGSGTIAHEALAAPVGQLLAELGVNLLTGGGGGVMRSVSGAFVKHRKHRGICIGILPCASEQNRVALKPGYPNEFVELAIRTHLPFSGELGTHDLSRNHINVLSATAIVALPGEHGTASEVTLALRYGRPLIAFASTDHQVRFPPEVRRTDNIDQIRQFLLEHVTSPATPPRGADRR